MRRNAARFNKQYLLPLAGFGGGIGAGFLSMPLGLTLTQRHDEGVDVAPPEKKQAAVGYNHQVLVGDGTRVDPYAKAIERAAAGRRALDIGTGPICLLARLCLWGGAASADAVEFCEASVQNAVESFKAEASGAGDAGDGSKLVPGAAALAVAEVREEDGSSGGHRATVRVGGGGPGRPEQELQLFEGLSTDQSLKLRGGYNLLVHELLGDLAGSEGAAAVIADVRARGLVTEDCVFVPRASSTMIAPTTQLRRTFMEKMVHRFGHAGTAELQPGQRYQAIRFDKDALLAEPQALELLDFQGQLELEQHRMLEFRTEYDGDFDGVHLHLHVDLDGRESIDVLDLHATPTSDTLCSWNTTYIRLLEEPIPLPAGSRIVLRCRADLRQAVLGETQESKALARYSLEAAVGEAGAEEQVASVKWRGG